MAGRLTVLTPDAQYPDDATVEREVGGEVFDFVIRRERSADRIPDDVWAKADALLVWHEVPITPALVAKIPRCRIVSRGGVGFDHIDLAACGAAGIPVCNVPDYGTSEVADHAIALMLALKRGLVSYDRALVADPHGRYSVREAPLVRRIRGAVLGLVGLGRIGTATALRAKPFGLDVVAYDPYASRGAELAVGVRRVASLHELLAQSDIVSLHAPLTAGTRGLIGREALAAMKPGAILVNTARGAIVDTAALADALRDGRLAGAAIDVLPEEPANPADPLVRAYAEQPDWLRGRLVMSPHAAWFSPESARDARAKAVEVLIAYLRDGELWNCVNAEHLTHRR